MICLIIYLLPPLERPPPLLPPELLLLLPTEPLDLDELLLGVEKVELLLVVVVLEGVVTFLLGVLVL